MGKFCTQCGAVLHPEYGLCPNCDAEKIAKMNSVPNFCTRCGGKVDETTGLCTACSHSFVTVETEAPAVLDSAPVQPKRPATPPVQGSKPAKKVKALKKKSSGSVFVTVLMSIFLFIFTFIGVELLGARLLVTNDDNIDQVMDEVEASDILSLMGDEFKESFYDTLRDFIKQETGATVTARKLEKLVEESSVKPFVSGKISDYINDILNHDDDFDVTKREVRKLFNQNSDVISEELGADVSEEVLDAVANWLVNEDMIDDMRPVSMRKSQPFAYYSMSIGFSWITLLLIAVLILLCIFVMVRNNASQAALCGGILFIVIGGLNLLVSLFTMMMPSLTGSIVGGDLIGAVVNVYFSSNILIYIVVLVLGVMALVARGVTRSVLAKRAQV